MTKPANAMNAQMASRRVATTEPMQIERGDDLRLWRDDWPDFAVGLGMRMVLVTATHHAGRDLRRRVNANKPSPKATVTLVPMMPLTLVASLSSSMPATL